MVKKYIEINEAEEEIKRQYDNVFKLVNKKVKPEDCFIKKNEAYTQKLFKFAIESFVEFLKARVNSDVQEVVRCENCRNYCKSYRECNLNGMIVDNDDFCSRGLKMDKERENNG